MKIRVKGRFAEVELELPDENGVLNYHAPVIKGLIKQCQETITELEKDKVNDQG